MSLYRDDRLIAKETEMKELLAINFESKINLTDAQMLDLLDIVFIDCADVVYFKSRVNAEADRGLQYSAVLQAKDKMDIDNILPVVYLLSGILQQQCVAFLSDEDEYGFVGKKPYDIFNKEAFFI